MWHRSDFLWQSDLCHIHKWHEICFFVYLFFSNEIWATLICGPKSNTRPMFCNATSVWTVSPFSRLHHCSSNSRPSSVLARAVVTRINMTNMADSSHGSCQWKETDGGTPPLSFGAAYGALRLRRLRFITRHKNNEFRAECVVVNHTHKASLVHLTRVSSTHGSDKQHYYTMSTLLTAQRHIEQEVTSSITPGFSVTVVIPV